MYLTNEEVKAFVFQGRRTDPSTSIKSLRVRVRVLQVHVPSRIPLRTRNFSSPIPYKSSVSGSSDDACCNGNKRDGVDINQNQSESQDSNDKDIDGKDSLKKSIEAPSVKNIILFAIPAIGIWLCGPLLSLIDTSAVGILAGTSQQAALNPAITITDDGALLVSFMYTATTNLVAAAYGNDKISQDQTETIHTIITALQLAMFVGIVFGIGLGGSSTFFIKAILGNQNNVDMEVITAAEKYVRIRALGMPAAVLIGVAQSACLGMKDTFSPLLVMIAAALVNLLGDFIFVGLPGAWLGGAAGAAWATVFSQYAALVMFIRWLCSKPIESVQGKNAVTARGILYNHFHARDLFRMPKFMNIARKISEYMVPVTTTAIGRVSGYVAMSHVVSCAFGTADMAAQQIVLAFFLCFIPMCDSLNLTAQSLVPGIHEYSEDLRLRSKVMKQTVSNFMKAGGIFGLILTGIVSLMPLVSRFFSRDAAVIASVNSTTPYLALFCAFAGVVCSGEGLLLARKDLGFLKNSFSAFFFAVPFFLLRLKTAIIGGAENIGLQNVWRIFAVYQVVRSGLWMFRLKILSIRDDRAVNVNESKLK